MNRFVASVAAALFVAVSISSLSAAPIWKFDGTQRFAATHDGNGFDIDDVGATAFVWAIVWANGEIDKFCHFEHSNNLAGATATAGNTAQYKMIVESVEQGAVHFGLGAGTGYGTSGIVYDFIKNTDQTIAHFKVESDKCTATNTLIYICAGPMESLHRELVATAADKRKFISLVSHSTWNEDFTRAGNGMTKNWAACKAIPGGAVFYDIDGQNDKLGTGDNNWAPIKTVTPKLGKTAADWQWVWSRQDIMNKEGDVSDCGMAFWVFSGIPKGTGADLLALWNNPKPSTPVGINSTPSARLGTDGNVNLSRTGSNLTVSLSGSLENGSVKVYDMMNRLVSTSELSNGSAVVPMANKAQGSYVMNIKAGNSTLVKHFFNR